MPDLLLLGAGHAHVEVLRQAALAPVAGLRITLVTPVPATTYSGLLPALIRGSCTPAQAQIACAPLARTAGARLVLASATGLDLAARQVRTEVGPIGFDRLSIDIGGGERGFGLSVRPIDALLAGLAALERTLPPAATVAVLGTGAGGTELALALADRLARRARIVLVGPAPVADIPPIARAAVLHALEKAGVTHIAGRACRHAGGILTTEDGTEIAVHAAIRATGVRPCAFLADSGLSCAADGRVLTDRALRSLSHPDVSAAGDCAMLAAAPRPMAGVWAVRAGHILAHNLLHPDRPREWHPPATALAILGLGGGRAVAWRGRLAVSGRLAWWWKRRIDQRWLARYQMAE